IARALLLNPRLLILDEPTEGLAPVIVAQVEEMLVRLGQEGDIAILALEQNIGVATAIAEHVAIMVNGRINRAVQAARPAAVPPPGPAARAGGGRPASPMATATPSRRPQAKAPGRRPRRAGRRSRPRASMSPIRCCRPAGRSRCPPRASRPPPAPPRRCWRWR